MARQTTEVRAVFEISKPMPAYERRWWADLHLQNNPRGHYLDDPDPRQYPELVAALLRGDPIDPWIRSAWEEQEAAERPWH